MRRVLVTASVVLVAGVGWPVEAGADPIEVPCPVVSDCGVAVERDNPLRPRVTAGAGVESAGAEVVVVSDHMTLGFGADATIGVFGNEMGVSFNRRGDKVRVCVKPEGSGSSCLSG